MKKNQIHKTLLFLFVIFVFINCKNETSQNEISNSSTKKSISNYRQGQAFIEDSSSTPNVLHIAMKSHNHTTLVAALQAAGLENVLVNAGPLMVFAPTNEAFDALPEGTLENLLNPENKETLANILKHHVTAGNYSKEFLKKFKKLGQADDQNTTVEVKGEDVFVGGAKIIGSIEAGNGIVHIVDKVILPPSN